MKCRTNANTHGYIQQSKEKSKKADSLSFWSDLIVSSLPLLKRLASVALAERNLCRIIGGLKGV